MLQALGLFAFCLNAITLPTQPDLATARDAVRAAKAAAPLPTGGLVVPIAAGRHTLTGSVVFEAGDSGEAGAPIVYRGEPGASLHGGGVLPAAAFAPVTDAATLARIPAEARGQVLVCDLAAQGVPPLEPLQTYGFGRGLEVAPVEVYVGGREMRPARYPNDGWLELEKVPDRGSVWGSIVGGEPELKEKPDRGAVLGGPDPERLARWKTANDLWLFGYWWWDWADQAVKVESIDLAAGTMKTAQPHTYGFRPGARYYAFNLLEELDQPGEMYLDREAGKLYLWPPKPLSEVEVEISLVKEPLLAVRGASNLVFENLTFETSRGQGVLIEDGNQVELRGCRIARTGLRAASISGGEGCRIADCDITDTNGGITVSGGDRRTLTPGGHVIENCLFRNYARIQRTYSGAIHLYGVGNRASHNQISDAPHSGLFFGGNDHVIEFNEFYDVCRETSDAGVIYAGRSWADRGNVIRGNFIHDIRGIGGLGAFGIYLDDMYSSAEVTGNVLANMANWSFLLGGGRDNVVRDNVTYRTGPFVLDQRALNWAAKTIGPGGTIYDGLVALPYKEPPWSTRFPTLPAILDDEPAVPKGNVIERNLFVATPEPDIAPMAQQFGTIRDNVVTTDASMFVDPAALDLRIKPDSAVITQIPGFHPPDANQAGLVLSAHRLTVAPARPVLTGPGGLLVGTGSLTLADRTPGAVIHYTLDGTDPTAQSPRYAEPIAVSATTELRAVAISPQGTVSEVLVEPVEVRAIGPGQPIYLSELPAIDVAGYGGGLKRDENMDGKPISLGGQTMAHGLLMHPGETPTGGLATATWQLERGLASAKRFLATVDVEDHAGQRGSVRFYVDLWRDGQWQTEWQSGVLRGRQAPAQVDVPINGATKIRLRVDDGGDNINSDHAAWGNARLE